MSAPQPGTPLPWAMCETAPNDQWREGITFYGVPQGIRIGDLSRLRLPEDRAKDGAYLIHAANNFPKAQALADALRDVLAWFYRIEGKDPQSHTALGRAAAALADWEGK